MEEPLPEHEARSLIRAILRNGNVRFSRHALKRMDERDMSELDCANVLRGGVVDLVEQERGTWRKSSLSTRPNSRAGTTASKKLAEVPASPFGQVLTALERLATPRMWVVVAFRGPETLVVVSVCRTP